MISAYLHLFREPYEQKYEAKPYEPKYEPKPYEQKYEAKPYDDYQKPHYEYVLLHKKK